MFEAIIQGRLGKDPEMRYTPNGTAVLNFSIAHNWQYKDQNITKWVNATATAIIPKIINPKQPANVLIRLSSKASITFAFYPTRFSGLWWAVLGDGFSRLTRAAF